MKENITAIVFLIIIFSFMSIIFGNAMYQNLIVQNNAEGENEGELRKRVSIDWREEYPFTYARTYQGKADENKKNIWNFIDQRINGITTRVDLYATEKMPFRVQLVGVYHKINQWLGMEFVTGDETTLELMDNYFISSAEVQDTREHSWQVYCLKEFLDRKEIPLLYVQAPYKTDKYDNKYENMDDPINDMGDTLKDQLMSYGVDTLDLREVIYEEKLSLYEMFYGTDHHWKVETGLWAAKKILQELDENYNINLNKNILDREFVCRRYEKRFLGSLGKRVTLGVAELEDFTEIYPCWDTDITIEVPNYEYLERGRFEDVIIDRAWLDKTEDIDYYNEYIYESYCYGNNSLIKLHNNQLDNGKRVLLLSNSFGLVVTPFLALTSEYVIQLHPGFFNGSIKNFIEQENPDLVVILYCPSSIAPITGDGSSSIFVFD